MSPPGQGAVLFMGDESNGKDRSMGTLRKKINALPPEKRSELFNGLALAANYPSQALVEDLCSGAYSKRMVGVLATLGLTEDCARLEDLAGRYTSKHSRFQENLLALEKAYTRMCFASKPRQVYLFGSVYNEGKLLQDSTFQIARLYHEAGLQVDDTFRLPPDHIALELEFMAYLCHQEARAAMEKETDRAAYAQRLQGVVLDNHLGPFAYRFGQKMAKYAPGRILPGERSALHGPLFRLRRLRHGPHGFEHRCPQINSGERVSPFRRNKRRSRFDGVLDGSGRRDGQIVKNP